ncbi:hypothetical protein ERO13_A10G156466v2 [Gossypium hirsutum]|uniref:Uncharacterized protein isoform X1 n=1 Tax=Gossypium hirsutum TaxID=3635 RepID=A0ABM2YYS8_GOSHI|nr:uncharacterized protein LOC107896001 isoform X1 [Gossypium hirsutum]KAG4180258.1 hypothetical protein ERO13_A10G156466v2 [Gossypium hirsutum]
MAYLSHSERTSKDNHNCPSSEENEWLELGLGFSIAPKKQDDRQHQPNPNIAARFPVSAAASSHLRAKQKPPGCSSSNSTTGLELGLSLGIDSETHEEDDDDDDEGGNYGQMAVGRNQDGGDDYGDDDDDYDDMAWWWPCHMNSGSFNDWQVPVPNNSHHYIPRNRPHSGLWFTLHSYTNRRNGEALPQIPKAYIRVKDENVTIFMVKKYLVRKLGLSNEAEVEISCMGQRLVHTQTLKQVRDSVWLPRFLESESTFHHYSLQTNSANNHLMSLYYGRRCAFN